MVRAILRCCSVRLAYVVASTRVAYLYLLFVFCAGIKLKKRTNKEIVALVEGEIKAIDSSYFAVVSIDRV